MVLRIIFVVLLLNIIEENVFVKDLELSLRETKEHVLGNNFNENFFNVEVKKRLSAEIESCRFRDKGKKVVPLVPLNYFINRKTRGANGMSIGSFFDGDSDFDTVDNEEVSALKKKDFEADVIYKDEVLKGIINLKENEQIISFLDVIVVSGDINETVDVIMGILNILDSICFRETIIASIGPLEIAIDDNKVLCVYKIQILMNSGVDEEGVEQVTFSFGYRRLDVIDSNRLSSHIKKDAKKGKVITYKKTRGNSFISITSTGRWRK